MTFNALALYLLNLAADAAPAKPPATPAKLPADRAGAFVDGQQADFATVRHRRVWFAVHGRAVPPDLRNDFGLVAAKLRRRDGWVNVVPPRPFLYSHRLTSGPVIVRDGQRLMPGGTVSLGHGGAVKVDGPVPVRFAPTRRGVRIAVRAQAGDAVTYTAYVPKDTRYPVTPKPRARVKRGKRTFASCCSTSMVALKYRVRVRRERVVSFTVGAPDHGGTPQGGRPQGVVAGGKGGTNWLIVAITAAVLAAFLAVRNLPRRT
jgi:hypothetical protein